MPAGHDKFPLDSGAAGDDRLGNADDALTADLLIGETLNMTYLALSLSHYVNGVAKKHGEVSRRMFARVRDRRDHQRRSRRHLDAPPFQALFDQHIAGWREDNYSLRYALSIPPRKSGGAPGRESDALVDYVNATQRRAVDAGRVHARLRPPGHGLQARRPAVLRPRRACARSMPRPGRLQIVLAGKAHPQDHGGKELIQRICQAMQALRGQIQVAYLPNYDMALAERLVGGRRSCG